MSEENRRINPLIAAAAVAVIVFSAVGVGVMTGVIPSSKSSADALSKAETTAVPAPEHKSSAPAAPRSGPAAAPRQPKTHVAANEPGARPAPEQAVAPRVCHECGVIDSIDAQEHKGAGSGIGAVGGAVVGGLLGNQIGSGRGNTAATVVGAVGGAVAGNEVEKRVKSTKDYKVSVRMDDRTFQSFTFDTAPAYAVGDKVKVIDGRLIRN